MAHALQEAVTDRPTARPGRMVRSPRAPQGWARDRRRSRSRSRDLSDRAREHDSDPGAAMLPPAVVSETRSMSTPRPSAVTVPSPDEMMTAPCQVRSRRRCDGTRVGQGTCHSSVDNELLGRATSGCSRGCRRDHAGVAVERDGRAVPKTPRSLTSWRSRLNHNRQGVEHEPLPVPRDLCLSREGAPRPAPHDPTRFIQREPSPRRESRPKIGIKRRRSRAVSATSSRHEREVCDGEVPQRTLAGVDEAPEASDDQFVDPSWWRISEMRAPATRSVRLTVL
jgi:hypothetical protein